jgi:hypothetical protein
VIKHIAYTLNCIDRNKVFSLFISPVLVFDLARPFSPYFFFRDSKVTFQTLNLLFLHVSNTDLLFKVALRLLPSEDNRTTQTQKNFTPPTCHDTAITTSWQIKTGRTLHGTDTGISPEMIY